MNLFKHCLWKQDTTGVDSRLHYLRAKDRAEVDFCICENDSPVQMIETKYSGPETPKAIHTFNEKYGIPGTVIFRNLKRERKNGAIELREAWRFFTNLEK